MIVLSLLFALFLQSPPQAPPPTGSIEGLTIRAGFNPPVVLVNARLELTGPVGNGTAITRTDAGGHFAFANLPAGSYRLRITKDGFVRQEYRQIGLDKPGRPLSLKPRERVDNIVFRLEPATAIVGVIRDTTGERVPDMVVQALKRGFDARGNPSLKLMASTVTDDHGLYRLFLLDPGEYFVSATPPPPQAGTSNTVAYVPTYFPGFVEIDAAKVVRIEYGREAVGIDFRVLRVSAMNINGYVTSSLTRDVDTQVLVVPPEDGAGVAKYAGKVSPQNGAYGIGGVPPGTYLFTAKFGNESAAIRVRVKPNVTNSLRVDLRLSAGLTIPGRVFSDVPLDLKTVRIHLSEIDPALPEPDLGVITPAGQFTMPGVQPGTYTVQVDGLINDQYLKAAVFGSSDALEQRMAVALPASPELQIQIGSDGGRITGTVFDRNNAPYPSAEVILVPTSVSRFRFDRYRTAITEDNGQFTIRGIPPGDYKLFAWEDLEPNAHLNVDFMRPYESMGTPVHVESNSNGTVSLRAISGL